MNFVATREARAPICVCVISQRVAQKKNKMDRVLVLERKVKELEETLDNVLQWKARIQREEARNQFIARNLDDMDWDWEAESERLGKVFDSQN